MVASSVDRSASIRHNLLFYSVLHRFRMEQASVFLRVARRVLPKDNRVLRQLTQLLCWPVGPLTDLDRTVTLPLPCDSPPWSVARQGLQFFLDGGAFAGKASIAMWAPCRTHSFVA